MELLAVLLIVYLLVMPLVAFNIAKAAGRRADEMEADLRKLREGARERQDLLRRIRQLEIHVKGAPDDIVYSGEAKPVSLPPPKVQPAAPVPAPIARPVPIAPVPAETPAPRAPAFAAAKVTPPPIPAAARPAAPAAEPKPSVSLEQFMGVKLFAWVGGLALFLGLVFFAKLSFERGWISPELRTGIGFAAGLALVVAGLWFNAKKTYAVLGQTLCATGVVVLYGMIYAAHAYYKFPLFANPLTAFALMVLITAAAFLMAVRMSAQVVAVLGMAGGFLTPIVCSTGHDNPLGLFGYIAMLDIGVLAVAKRRRWHYLTGLTAAGTIIMQAGWFTKFFDAEGYAYGAKTWIAVAVFLGFAALFTAALAWLSKGRDKEEEQDKFHAASAIALCGSAMVASFVFLSHGSIADRPWLLYTFLLLINLVVMAAAWVKPSLGPAPAITGLATFLHLTAWTFKELTPDLLPQALVVYLVFGMLHTTFGVLWQRRKNLPLYIDAAWVPVTILLLLAVPVVQLRPVPFMVWPAILLVDLAIIASAAASRSLRPTGAALVLTMATAGFWLFNLPPQDSGSLTAFLPVTGGFAMVFAAAGVFLARRAGENDRDAQSLPVFSAVMPFALLIMAVFRLDAANPAPVFGLALVLSLFLLALGTFTRNTALPLTALLCVLALEGAWHEKNFDPAQPLVPLIWYLGFYALFSLHPYLFRRRFAASALPWISAAVAGPGTFALVYYLVKIAWPNDMMGLLPAAFAIPALLGLFTVLRLHAADNPVRLTQLAWFGGVALGFITLIFPIQFEKQWLTVSWALEGAALCWLFRRVPHPGLPRVGAVLLAVAFARLALNPAVLSYHVRGETAILNWQLYAYTVSAAAMFLGAWWLGKARHLFGGWNVRAFFTALGGILLFLLLNIEIADVFTPPGSRSLVLEFSNNFARDMTYSIAWGLFALALLIIGFAKRSRHTRYAGIGLLAVTLLKLFFHDLAQIDSAYRIGALIAVALIALAASFLYQRFSAALNPAGDAEKTE
ncbi:MAG TPA: DUF2339 domain-containing protein [Verrucomicrobiales bacterium]|jgi:hypothetical protein|nr:DUF2339 domain-containing protein [Verrucomicrobiales bacterium]